MIKFICYPKCTTCQKAKKWLDDNKIKYEFRNIKEINPEICVEGHWVPVETSDTLADLTAGI